MTTRMHFWDFATGRALAGPVEVDGWVSQAVYSPDDRWLVTTGPDETLLVWDPYSGQFVRQIKIDFLPGFIKLAFSPDGRALAAGHCDLSVGSCAAYRIQVFDFVSGQELAELLVGPIGGQVSRITFSPDGTRLGISARPTPYDVWWDWRAGQVDTGMDGVPVGLFSPDGRTMVIERCEFGNDSTCGVGLLTLWDVQQNKPLGQPIRNLDQSVTVLGFSPDGASLYTPDMES